MGFFYKNYQYRIEDFTENPKKKYSIPDQVHPLKKKCTEPANHRFDTSRNNRIYGLVHTIFLQN